MEFTIGMPQPFVFSTRIRVIGDVLTNTMLISKGGCAASDSRADCTTMRCLLKLAMGNLQKIGSLQWKQAVGFEIMIPKLAIFPGRPFQRDVLLADGRALL